MHGLHAVRARRRDVVGVVVDEHGFGRLDAHARARELVDLALGLAHADVARVDDLFEQLVEREHRAPVLAELLHVVREQAEPEPAVLQLADLVHDHPVHARRALTARSGRTPPCRSRCRGSRARVRSSRVEVGRDVDLALLEQVPVGLVVDRAGGFGRVGIVGDRLGDRARPSTPM